MKVIDRYIMKELLPPFFLGLLLFTFVLLINRIFKLTDLVINKGAALWPVLKLFSYIMPSFFTLTIPMAVLLAALVAFGRLSTDSEIIALKATGFSIYRMMAPAIALSVAALLVTAYFSLYLAPAKARTFKKDLFILAKTKTTINVEEEVFNDSFKNLVIYTQKTPSPDQMEGVFISDERNPAEPYVIIAQKGAMDVDPANGYAYLSLVNGSIHKKGSRLNAYQEITFDKNDLAINLFDKFFAEGDSGRNKREMTMGELKDKAQEMKEKGGEYRPLLTEYYKRLSIPFACIVFGLIGPPLGLYSRRSGKSSGMTVALVIFALYYLLMKGGENLATGGQLPPLVAALIPNLVIGGLGAYILINSARERRLDPGGLVSAYRRRVRFRDAVRHRRGGGR